MIAVRAIYDGRKVKFLEDIHVNRPTKIIVIFLDDEPLSNFNEIDEAEESSPLNLSDDLIGGISVNKDGSVNHDKYIYSKENL